jgi:hypothetical protein
MRYNRMKDFIKGRMDSTVKMNNDRLTNKEIFDIIYDVPIKE